MIVFNILRLLSKDQSVVALGQRIGEVSGVKIQAKQVPFTNIHTVTLYLNSLTLTGTPLTVKRIGSC